MYLIDIHKHIIKTGDKYFVGWEDIIYIADSSVIQ